jgi:hypothetical protein
MRLAPVSTIGPRLLDFSTSDDVQKLGLGTTIEATGTDYDTTANVANWGAAELVYVANASVAILPGALVVMDKNFRVVATAASEANSGKPVYVALTHFAAGSTTIQYGWVLRRGICPVKYSVAATTGRVFGGTAGLATPTAAVGVQILNAICLIAAASTFTRAGTTRTGSSLVRFSSVAGMYPGQAISGSGVPGSSVISSIDPAGNGVIIGSAVGTPVAATASATVTCTMTNTGHGIVQVDCPVFQSQIT